MAVKKADLVKVLVDKYGYDKEDLKFDSEGKLYTTAKLQGMIKSEEKDAEQSKNDATRVKASVKSLKDTDKIYVMNGLTDTLVYHSERSNMTWQFSSFGEQDTIPYGELVTMRNRYPRYFTEGWLIVLDTEVQEEFKLTEMYKNILTPENMDSVFDLGIDELEKFIDNLPEGQKIAFVNKAQEKIENDTLVSRHVEKLIENKFKFRFEDNAPIEDTVLQSELSGSAKIIIVDKK